MILSVLDLFSGIGGFSLGLERTGGFRTVAFCEVDAYCQKVLRRHWPHVPIHDDVRRLGVADLMERIDVVCGGFPCQDISLAGQCAGLSGARSGLWFEMFRIIAETRPRYVIVENVAALRARGLDVVLGCLASIRYDAEWHCIPAAAVGAPHRRDRVWIMAYPQHARRNAVRVCGHDEVASAMEEWSSGATVRQSADVPDADSGRLEGRPSEHESRSSRCASIAGTDGCDADSARLAIGQSIASHYGPKLTAIERTDWWLAEPDVGRVVNGIPARVDRLKALGNSIVPQIAEQIGMSILYHEALHA